MAARRMGAVAHLSDSACHMVPAVLISSTLRCEGHVSTAWSWAPWWRACGIVMCGHVLGGWVFQPKISHTHSLNQTSTAPVEQVKSD